MSEFISKKLGEVWAFSRIGIELAERGEDAATVALGGDEKAAAFKKQLAAYAAHIEADADDTTIGKADATEQKLRGMMEAYIGDDWDNPVELLEWLSFYSGAAAAHWALVEGATSDVTAREAHEYFHDVLHHVVHSLQAVGEKKAEQ